MFGIKRANKGLGEDLIVLESPFFNNRVYSKSFLCYGNIKIASWLNDIDLWQPRPGQNGSGFYFSAFWQDSFSFLSINTTLQYGRK